MKPIPSIPGDFALFIAGLLFIVAITSFSGQKDDINKSCVENGGYVKQYRHYSTCSQDKPGYRNGVRK